MPILHLATNCTQPSTTPKKIEICSNSPINKILPAEFGIRE